MASNLPRFEELLEAHHDEIYAYLWRLLDGASHADAAIEAQDLAQDTFMRAYKAYSRLPGDSNPRAWLYKIATNGAMSLMRRNGRSTSLSDDDFDEPPVPSHVMPEPQAIFKQSVDAVRDASADLPVKQRAALVLRYIHEMEYDEIAVAIGSSEDSACANVYQALKRLRVVLGDNDEN